MAMTGRIKSVLFLQGSLLTSCVWKVNTCAVQRACPSSLCKLPFITRAYYGDINFFGGPSATSVKASAKLRQLEEENEDAMFVIVSDVWLDNIEVMEKLGLMFSGVFLYLQRLHFHLTHKLSALSDAQVIPPPRLFLPGYDSMPPTCFIFCGNFSSAPYGNAQIKSLKGSDFTADLKSVLNARNTE